MQIQFSNYLLQQLYHFALSWDIKRQPFFVHTYLYGCYTVQLAILFPLARTSSLPTIPLFPFRHHPTLPSLSWIECSDGIVCMHCDGTRVIDVVPIVILEFANCRQLYTTITTCRYLRVPAFYSRTVLCLCAVVHSYELRKIFTNIRSYPQTWKEESYPQRNGCKHRVRYARFAYAEIEYRSRLIGWHRFPLVRNFTKFPPNDYQCTRYLARRVLASPLRFEKYTMIKN